jgi:hypothetical protein
MDTILSDYRAMGRDMDKLDITRNDNLIIAHGFR